jgi:penicillin G amidase
MHLRFMRKWIKRILLSVLALIFLGVLLGYLWLNGSKPTYAGQLQLKGLQQAVDVHFDEYGVPHIYAQNNHDLYMAFGYVHAQDRLFQMEMLRRAGSGRLAEIVGRPLLKVDKMIRSLGLIEYAQESAAYMETQKGTPMYNDVQAYLEGINYFVANGSTPPEFSIIGIEKTPFKIEDMYYASGAMAFNFSMAQKTEPVIDFIQHKYGDTYLHDIGLWHDSTETFIRTTNGEPAAAPSIRGLQEEQRQEELQGEEGTSALRDEAIMEFANAMTALEEMMPYAPLDGSNSWVLNGSKTKSKEVIFCNDTHIGYLLPQTWYEAHLNSPEIEMYGHFLGGVPFALIGRNRQLSWGITMLENDDVDFYMEKTDEANANNYVYKGESIPYKIATQIIKIKGEADTTIQVRYTEHGPIINDVFEGMNNAQPLSMFWTYTKLPNRTLDSFYGMNNAHTMQEFEKNLAPIHAPGLNVNYGDKAGNIAYWAVAALIERPDHVNSFLMLDGASGADDVLGFYPFELNPRTINPEWGYIYSANDWPQAINTEVLPSDDKMKILQNRMSNLFTESTRGLMISKTENELKQDRTNRANYITGLVAKMQNRKLWYPGYYKPQYRANRIRQLLESKNDWDLTSIQQVMTDAKNVADSSLLSWFKNDLDSVPAFADSVFFRQYDELFAWDGTYDPRLPQPTFFNKMLYHYLHLSMADEIGEERFNMFLTTHQVQRTQNFLYAQKNSAWWDTKGTYPIETRKDIIYKAFEKSINELRTQFGDNPKIWSWQKAATMEIKHPLGEVAIFKPLFNVGPNPVWGGNETIMQAGYKLDSTGHYKVYYGSQMRILVDFANVDSTLNITPCGQSGHLISKHYRDQADMYRNKKFRTAWMRKSKIQEFEKLVMVP